MMTSMNMQTCRQPGYQPGFQRQQGAALVVGLIMLALMTIIGLTAVQSSIVENRIATNTYDKQLSFESAEAAQRDAEAWLDEQEEHPEPKLDGSSNKVWPKGKVLEKKDAQGIVETENGKPVLMSARDIRWDEDGRSAGTIEGTAAPAKYVIEEFTFVPDDSSTETIAAGKGLFYYRITSKGYGGSVGEDGKAIATTVLQTMYRKRFK